MDTESTKQEEAYDPEKDSKWADANKKLKNVAEYKTRNGAKYKVGETYWYVDTAYIAYLEHPAKIYKFALQKLKLKRFIKTISDSEDSMSAQFEIVESNAFGETDFMDDYEEVGETEIHSIDPDEFEPSSEKERTKDEEAGYIRKDADADPTDPESVDFWSFHYDEGLYVPQRSISKAFDLAKKRITVDAYVLSKFETFGEYTFDVSLARMNILNNTWNGSYKKCYEPGPKSVYNALLYYSIQKLRHSKALERGMFKEERLLRAVFFDNSLREQFWEIDRGYVQMGYECWKQRRDGYFEEDGVDLRAFLKNEAKKAEKVKKDKKKKG